MTMKDDFSAYIDLKKSDGSKRDACKLALKEERDFTFVIRMLREVFGCDLVEARELAMKHYWGA